MNRVDLKQLIDAMESKRYDPDFHSIEFQALQALKQIASESFCTHQSGYCAEVTSRQGIPIINLSQTMPKVGTKLYVWEKLKVWRDDAIDCCISIGQRYGYNEQSLKDMQALKAFSSNDYEVEIANLKKEVDQLKSWGNEQQGKYFACSSELAKLQADIHKNA